jgi:enamine deaminase RidA (YjgF/YER057c/UK114 family)
MRGDFVGVQVHAVAGPSPPTPIRCCDQVNGMAARMIHRGDERWLQLGGLAVQGTARGSEQARRMFFCAGCFLRQAGTTMKSVARTWLWLWDIGSWYDEFNEQRRSFFEREGLIDRDQGLLQLPASTGVGIGESGGFQCAMDLIAIPGRRRQIEYIEASGHQGSAYEYGSAFSRACVAPMPAGPALFISGTAAIDAWGATQHVGDVRKQIDDTLAHVRCLLKQQGCNDGHVLSALAYCKTAEVERIFRRHYADLPWPRLTMVAELCRPNLLFEIEVTASCPN